MANGLKPFVSKNTPRSIGDPIVLGKILGNLAQAANGCLEWKGWRSIKGYGYMGAYSRNHRVTRLLWRILKGEIPPKMLVCHTCDNPPCCNIDHLWLGTTLENGLDSAKKKRCRMQKRTHCFRDHELTPENTYISPNGARHCKTCARIACRVRAGWPEHALEIPAQSVGQRPDFRGMPRQPAPKHLDRDGRANFEPSEGGKP